MGAELSIPGFGWATNGTSSTTSARGKVTLDPRGFVFDAATNRENLEKLLGESGSLSGTAPPREVISYAEVLSSLQAEVSESDYRELMSTNGTSCGQRMRFDVMSISPNTSFKLHAHPNVECIVVLKGAMHEYRYQGTNLTRERLLDLSSVQADLPASLFTLRTVTAPASLVNQPGSVHLSFTRDDPETLLLVLWSGSHWSHFANAAPLHFTPPLPSNVQPL